MASMLAFSVWAYRAVGLGHYKYGAEFYLRLWPIILVFIALNAMFRLYHGSVLHPYEGTWGNGLFLQGVGNQSEDHHGR